MKEDIGQYLSALNALCDESHANDAFQYLVQEGSKLITLSDGDKTPPKNTNSAKDTSLIQAFLARRYNKQFSNSAELSNATSQLAGSSSTLVNSSTSKSVSQKLFTPMQHIITDLESDTVLSKQLQNLLQLKGATIGHIGGVEQAPRLSKADRRRSLDNLTPIATCKELSQFLSNIVCKSKEGTESDLRTLLVIVKLLLCFLEIDADGFFQTTHLHLSMAVMHSLSSPSVISQQRIDQYLFLEKERERLTSFEAIPRLLLCCGSPSNLTALAVKGNAVGIAGGLSIRPFDGELYFEVKLKGSPKLSDCIRVGWVVNGSDLTAVESGATLGLSGECVVFDGSTGFLFHSARTAKSDSAQTPAISSTLSAQGSSSAAPFAEANRRLSRFDPLFQLPVDRAAVALMMVEDGISASEVERYIASKVTVPPLTDDEDGDDCDGLAALLNTNSSTAQSKPAIAIDQINRAIANGGLFLADTESYSWTDGTVLGCYINSDSGLIRFFSNGVEISTGSPPYLNVSSLLSSGQGVCPVFSCAGSVELEFNLGQVPFAFPLTPAACAGDPSPIYPHTQSPYLELDGVNSGITIAPVSTDRIKGFTIEVGFRLTESDFLITPDSNSDSSESSSRCIFSCIVADSPSSAPSCTISINRCGAIVFKMDGLDAIQSPNATILLSVWHHLSVRYPSRGSCDPRQLLILIDGEVVHSADIPESRQVLDNVRFGLIAVGGLVSTMSTARATPLSSDESKTSGSASATAPIHPDKSTPIAHAASVKIVSRADMGSFKGDISDFRLWSGERDIDQVASTLGRKTVTGSEANLILFLPLLEGAGEWLHDAAMSNNSLRSSLKVLVHGSYKWRHLATISDKRVDNLDVSENFSEFSERLLAANAAYLPLSDSNIFSPDEHGVGAVEAIQISVSVEQALLALICKFAVSADRFLEGDCGDKSKTWHRTVQESMPSIKSLAQPHVLNFLLLNSLLRQNIRMRRSLDTSRFTSIKTTLRDTSLALLRVLRVNLLDVVASGLSPAALGLTYSRSSETAQKSFVSKLLVTLLYFVSDDDQDEVSIRETDEATVPSPLCKEAIDALIAGFYIFFPHACDQIFLLICLLCKKFRGDAQFLARHGLGDLIAALDRVSNMSQEEQLPTDPFLALLSMSKLGDEALFKAVSSHLALFSNAAKLVPADIRPLFVEAHSIETPSRHGLEPVHNDTITPRPGDVACRGPHWRYGDQDGGAIKTGRVIEIVDWCGAADKGICVQWESGAANVYRWAVVEDDAASDAKFDISILRAASGDKKPAPYSFSFLEDNSSSSREASSTSTNINAPKEEIVKRELLYTPEEVNLSLVENMDTLTKRTVLAYMKETAPLSWQEKHKLTWSMNTVVKEFTSESTAVLYRSFFETFSSKMAPARVVSKANTVSHRDDLTVPLEQLLALLLRDMDEQYTIGGTTTADSDAALQPSFALTGCLQGLLNGSLGNTVTTDSSTLKPILLQDRLFTGKPTGASKAMSITWNWRHCAWEACTSASNSANDPSSSDCSKQSIIHFDDIGFEPDELSEGLRMASNNSVEHGSRRAWRSCRVYEHIEPDSGIYQWHASIESNGLGRRGNIIVGVCTSKYNPSSFIGQDSESWGLSSGKELLHNGRLLKSDYGHKITGSSLLQLTLNTFTGKLFIKDLSQDTNHEVEAAFSNGLKGKVLYPAFSMYMPGDCITIVPSPQSLMQARKRISTPDAPSVSGIPAGAPPAIVIKFTLQMLETASKALLVSGGVKNDLVSIGLVQLLSSLCRWQHVPQKHTKVLYDALNNFVAQIGESVVQAIIDERAIQSSGHEHGSNNLLIESFCSSHLLKQLACVCSCYMGRLAASMLVGDQAKRVDNCILASEIKLECGVGSLSTTSNDFKTSPVFVVGKEVHEWLGTQLFSQGLLRPTEGRFVSWGDIEEWIGDDNVLWKWLASHDRSHQTERGIGGAALLRTVKQMTVVTLYHTGLLKAALLLGQHLNDAVPAFSPEGLKPPVFLLKAWTLSMRLKTEAMRLKQSSGMQYPTIAQQASSRLAFLFELESCCQEQTFAFFGKTAQSITPNAILDELSKNASTQSKSLASIGETVRLFVIHDQCSNNNAIIAQFRAALRNVEYVAERRREALKNLRGSLEAIGTDLSWAAKAALLLHFPSAMRNENQNLLVAAAVSGSSSIARLIKPANANAQQSSPAGHYSYCLEGCSKMERMRIRGAFDSLYTYIANELSSEEIEPAVQLMLLNCLAVRINEEDHAMLSRVNIFYSIHELLTCTLSSEGPITAANATGINLAKAAMKLFILLTLQVAATGEGTVSKRSSSNASLDAPQHTRVKSGPATLSKAVFDILYTQLFALSEMLVAELASVVPHTALALPLDTSKPCISLPHIEISDDAMVIISEATDLLLRLASHEFCQRLLARPKWIALLFRLMDASPHLCQKRALLLLFDLLPVTSIEDLQSAEYVNLFNLHHVPGTTIGEKIIQKLIHTCGSVFLTKDLGKLIVTTKGANLLTAFTERAAPFTSICVAILRKLLMSAPAWAFLVHSAVLSTLAAPVTTELLSCSGPVCEMAACLFILGGYIESEYVDGHAIVDDGEGPMVGVITAMPAGSEKIEVTFQCETNNSIAESALYLSESPSLNAYSKHCVREVDLDRITAISRSTLSDLAVQDDIISAVLHLAECIIFEENAGGFSGDVGSTGEEKAEMSIQEEKNDSACGTPPSSSLNGNKSVIISALKHACSLALSSLSTNEKTADKLQKALMSSEIHSGSKLLTNLLSMAVVCTRSGGLADIPIQEEYVSLALTQRRKILAANLAEENLAKFNAAKELEEKARALESSKDMASDGVAPAAPVSEKIPQPDQSAEQSSASATNTVAGSAYIDSSSQEQEQSAGGNVLRGPSMSIGSAEEEELVMYDELDDEGEEDEDDEGDDEGDEAIVESLAAMGFPKRWCELALDMCNGDPDEALNYILSNGDSLDAMASAEQAAGARLALNSESDAQTEAPISFLREVLAQESQSSPGGPQVTLDQREYHYDSGLRKLLPLYAEPSLLAERVGSIFPGELVNVLEVVNALSTVDQWLRVDLADYKDESDDAENEEETSSAFAWLPRYNNGSEVILAGPPPSRTPQPLAHPPADSRTIDVHYRVIGSKGALVRNGVERATDEVIVLNEGELVRAVEETFNAEGTIRLRIIEPVCGWISKLASLVCKVTASGVTNAPIAPISEWVSLEGVDDDMEIWGGNDIYRRDDRFFRSLQGSHFQRCKDTTKNKVYLTHNRRVRVTGSPNRSSCCAALAARSLGGLDAIITSTLKTLTTLNCRNAILAIILRCIQSQEGGTIAETSGQSRLPELIVRMASFGRSAETPSLEALPLDPLSSFSQNAQTLISKLKISSLVLRPEAGNAKVAYELNALLRLVTFRGEPHTYTGLEWLAVTERDAIAMTIGKISVSLDEVLSPLVSSLLTEQSTGANNNFQSPLLHYLLLSVAHGIWQATLATQVEQSWDDSNYEDLLDDGMLQQANLHHCQWATGLLLKMRVHEVTFVVFRAWAMGLRGTSMSLKRIVFDQLSTILSSLYSEYDFQSSLEGQEMLRQFLAVLPVERLKVMGTRRLWYELEDSPAYSRYLQRLLHFLSIVETGQGFLFSALGGSEGSPASSPKGTALQAPHMEPIQVSESCSQQFPMAPRPVLRFASASSQITLNPQKDMHGSWTVEMWIRREETSSDCQAVELLGGTASLDTAAGMKSTGAGESGALNDRTSTGGDHTESRRRDGARSHAESGRSMWTKSSNSESRALSFESRPSPFIPPATIASSALSSAIHEQSDISSSSLLLRANSTSISEQSPPPAFGIFGSAISQGGHSASTWVCVLCDACNPVIALTCTMCEFGTKPAAPSQQTASGSRTTESKSPPKELSSAPEVTVPSLHLLSSREWQIKLQAGGRLFGLTSEMDPQQDSFPVHERALCLALGQRGGPDRTFNYVVPCNEWVHIAISCKNQNTSASSQSTLSLYVNGKLRDSISMKFSLPVATIGSNKREQSFRGSLAELRIWSCARSGRELARDMLKAVSGKFQRRGVLAHLQFQESSGSRIFDSAGLLHTCKLTGTEWTTTLAPITSGCAFSPFMLGEGEDSSDFLGENDSGGVVEMTGVLKRDAVHAAAELVQPGNEVVSLCYRYVGASQEYDLNPALPDRKSVGERCIEGYIDWSERGVRTMIHGMHNVVTGAISFAVVASGDAAAKNLEESVVVGPPEALSWLESMSFSGTLGNDGIKGNLRMACLIDAPQPLRAGQSRLDKRSISSRCTYKRSLRGVYGPVETVSMRDGADSLGRTLCTIELAPIPPSTECGSSPSPESQSRPVYGLVYGSGCMWVEWIITKSSGAVCFGLTTAEAFRSEQNCEARGRALDLSSDERPPVVHNGVAYGTAWVYSITGTLTCNGQTIHCEPAGDGDTVGIQMDMERDSLCFYRNDLLLHEYTGLAEHPLLQPFSVLDSERNSAQGAIAADQRGLRPFLSLAAPGDTVTYRGAKTGATTVRYTNNDALGRAMFTGRIEDGRLAGKGVLRYIDSSMYWYGYWRNGFQDGVNIKVRVDPTTLSETIESVHMFHEGMDVCDITESMDDLPEVTDWRASAIATSLARTSSGGSTSPPQGVSANSNIPPPPGSPPRSATDGNHVRPSHPRSPAAPPRPPPVKRDDVTIRIRDSSNVDVHLKMNRNVKLQKAFDLFASKKGLVISSLRFLLDGEPVEGDSTPEVLDLGDNELITVEMGSGSNTKDYEKLLALDAPYILRIVFKDGATVRSGIEIEDSQQVRHLASGAFVEAFHRSVTKEGIGRYLVCDGWLSERLRSPSEERVVEVMRELPVSGTPWKYRVCDNIVAIASATPELEAATKGTTIPSGTIVEVAEMRSMRPTSSDDSNSSSSSSASSEPTSELQSIIRLRVISPAEYIGWVNDKSVSRINASVCSSDPEVLRELGRRAQIRTARVLAARKDGAKQEESLAAKDSVMVNGHLDASAECLFLLNGTQRSTGVSISTDFKTVTASPQCQGRSMALGSRGFSRGTHYWEVQIDSLVNGNIFIGVAPADYVQSWGGYGFVNYRIKISLTTDETMYGRWTKPGDTIGVLLNMDLGTLSFFVDTPEDMMSTTGLGKVRNMGVSHQYLRRLNSGRYPVLYPCFGIKHQGDQISIRKCKWVSRKGIDAAALFKKVMAAKGVITSWRDGYSAPHNASSHPWGKLIPFMYDAYKTSHTQKRFVMSRPGLAVLLDTNAEAIFKACGVLAEKFHIAVGSKFKSRYGPGCVVGARMHQLWYTLDSADAGESGTWYWGREELEDYVNLGYVNFDIDIAIAATNNATGDAAVSGSYTMSTPRSPGAIISSRTASAPLLLTHDDFLACAFPSIAPPPSPRFSSGTTIPLAAPWTLDDDVALSAVVNAFADSHGDEPTHLYPEHLEAFRCKLGVLPHRDRHQFHARYTCLCIVSRAAEIVMPLCDFGKARGVGAAVVTEYEQQLHRRIQQGPYSANGQNRPVSLNTPDWSSAQSAASFQSLIDIKSVIFSRTKRRFWGLVVRQTTSTTAEPPDEWDKPPDLKEIRLNRLVARSLSARKDSVPYSERLKESVFGQLIKTLDSWDDSLLRRAYQHYPDAGQARAFFVKFEGEGSDDLGGPYRAVFDTCIGEECVDLLDLLVPCPNGQSNDFQNRDKMVFNTGLTTKSSSNDAADGLRPGSHAVYGSQKAYSVNGISLYVHLGKLIAMACRHAIQVPLSLPSLVWKPLLGEPVGSMDLRAIDTRTTNYLESLLRAYGQSDSRDTTAGAPEEAKELLRGMLERLKESNPSMTMAAMETLMIRCMPESSIGENSLADTAANHGNDGKNLSLTHSGFDIYDLCALVEHLHLLAQNDGITALFRGLDAVLPTEIFPLFSSQEIESIFCGAAKLDIEVLKGATVYEGVAPFDPHVQYFWTAFEQLTQEDRSKFINFCSGRSRLPSSASAFTMSFKISKPPPETTQHPDRYLPKASTCFFTLNLPAYSSVEVSGHFMRTSHTMPLQCHFHSLTHSLSTLLSQVCLEKLRYAIRNTDVMDADHLLHTGEGWGGVV